MPISWTVHPIKQDSRKSVFLVIFIGLIALLVFFSFNSISFSLVAIALLLVSMRQFFIKTHYTLDEEGVKVRSVAGSQSRAWNYFKGFSEDKNGVLLSPFEGRSRLENFRGIYMLLPTEQPDRSQIMEIIRKNIPIK